MSIAERLAEITWECYSGRFDSLRRLVEAAGGQTRQEHGWLWVRATHGMTLGVPQGGDPITVLVQVCFALLGPMWAQVPEVQHAMQLVNRQWRERQRDSKPGSSRRYSEPSASSSGTLFEQGGVGNPSSTESPAV